MNKSDGSTSRGNSIELNVCRLCHKVLDVEHTKLECMQKQINKLRDENAKLHGVVRAIPELIVKAIGNIRSDLILLFENEIKYTEAIIKRTDKVIESIDLDDSDEF